MEFIKRFIKKQRDDWEKSKDNLAQARMYSDISKKLRDQKRFILLEHYVDRIKGNDGALHPWETWLFAARRYKAIFVYCYRKED